MAETLVTLEGEEDECEEEHEVTFLPFQFLPFGLLLLSPYSVSALSSAVIPPLLPPMLSHLLFPSHTFPFAILSVIQFILIYRYIHELFMLGIM